MQTGVYPEIAAAAHSTFLSFPTLVSSTVSKIQLFFLSLVGAVPAGFLSYLLAMYLISQPSGASSMVMIITIITLICTAVMTLIPVLVLALYYSNYDPPRPEKGSKSKDEDLEEAEDEDATPAKSDDEIDAIDEVEGSESDEMLSADDGELLDEDEEEK